VHNGGYLHVQHNQSLGMGACTFQSPSYFVIDSGLVVANAFSLEASATFSLSGTSTLSGAITGAGALVLGGGGVLRYTGAGTYTGPTTIASGTLLLSEGGAISKSQGVLILDTLDISETTSGTQIISLSGSGLINLGEKTLTVSQTPEALFTGVIQGTGGLTLASSSTGFLILSNMQTYTGATEISAGGIALSGIGSIASSSSVTIASTGTLDISAATLAVNINTLSGAGGIELGSSTLNILQQTSQTFSGVIRGVLGNISYQGTSGVALTLESVSLYTGTTTIASGTLTLSGDGSIRESVSVDVLGTLNVANATSPEIKTLSGSGSIILGPMLTIRQLAPGTFSGVISGSTGGIDLSVLSTSTLTLSGINTYVGSTEIHGGTLVIEGAGSIALSRLVDVQGTLDIASASSDVSILSLTGTGSIVLGSRSLYITQGTRLSFSGVVSGGGGLVLTPLSTNEFMVEGVNTYTGETYVAGGTLSLVGSGSIASSVRVRVDSVLNIADLSGTSAMISNLLGSGYVLVGQKTLSINQTEDHEFSGMILGTIGTFVKEGAAKLIVTGSNAFSGTVTVTQGMLEGNTASLPSSIVNNASLVFNQSSDGTYTQEISGVGTFIKRGLGALTLSQENTYTGTTTVLEGVLIVEGGLPNSHVTVASEGSLRGTGEIFGLNSYGVVAPGQSSGTMHVMGNITLETGSIYEVSVDENGMSLLSATGTIAIDTDVTCVINPESGFFAAVGEPHVILRSSIITGTFSSLTSTSPLVGGLLTYHPSYVELMLELQPLASLGLKGNSEQVALAIDMVLQSGNRELDEIAASLYVLSEQALDTALNQMQPALYKAIVLAQENNLLQMNHALHVRMQHELDARRSCALCERTWNLWTGSFGDNLHQGHTYFKESPQIGYQDNTAGAILGMDGHFAKVCYAGSFVGYTGSSLAFENKQGDASIHTGYGGIYFSALGRMFYVNSSLLWGWSAFRGERLISYPGIEEKAHQAHHGKQILAHIDTGINWNIHGWTIRPFDAVDYVASRASGFTETNAGDYDLIVNPSNSSLFRNELGLEFSYCLCVHEYRWMISPKVSWVREIRSSGTTYTATFVRTDVPFTVTGYLPTRNLLASGGVLTGTLGNDHVLWSLFYNGTFGASYSDHNYGGELQFRF